MGFWIFMFVSDLLVPAISIFFGLYFSKHPPKDINYVFGYRTKRSMKSQKAWKFAHRFFGRLLFKAGILMTLLIIPLFFFMKSSIKLIGNVGGGICIIQCMLIILLIPPTESALKKRFDENSRPIDNDKEE